MAEASAGGRSTATGLRGWGGNPVSLTEGERLRSALRFPLPQSHQGASPGARREAHQ